LHSHFSSGQLQALAQRPSITHACDQCIGIGAGALPFELKALVEAAGDIDTGRVHTWDEFKPMLAKLRARAKHITLATSLISRVVSEELDSSQV
jgi:hypothetical protein